LHHRGRLAGLEVGFEPLDLGMLHGQSCFDLGDDPLVVGLSGGEATLPLGLSLLVGGGRCFVRDPAFLPQGEILLASTRKPCP
jgi:hypothetical protein